MRSFTWALATLAIATAGCSSHSSPTAAARYPASGSNRPAPTSPPATPSDAVRVERMHNNYVHFPVASQDIHRIINVHGSELAGLADEGAFFGTTYPAISTNDGASWAISGPELTHPGADGAHATDQVGATSNHVIVLWGRGGQFVEVLPPGARYWYQAGFPNSVRRVAISGRSISVSLSGVPKAEVSTDDGLAWRS